MFTAHSKGLINICKYKYFMYFDHILPITLHSPFLLMPFLYPNTSTLIACVSDSGSTYERTFKIWKSHIIGLCCCKWFTWNKLIFPSSNYLSHSPCSFTQRVIPTIATNIFLKFLDTGFFYVTTVAVLEQLTLLMQYFNSLRITYNVFV